MAISIVIVNFNGQKWLGDCLRSIRSQKIKNLEVIIVDNNSTDDSVKIVAREYPDAKVIKNKTNLGFGRGNNLGAKKATSELLFFLNNDTLLQPNCLREVERQVHLKHLDLASPKLLNFSNVDFYKGRKLTLDIVGSLSWGKKITMIEGCGLIIKKKVFESLGGFDSSFFMYSEDLDLCWRAWLCGYKIKMINTASINHFGGGITPMRVSEACLFLEDMRLRKIQLG
jgi:hypothetical protein